MAECALIAEKAIKDEKGFRSDTQVVVADEKAAAAIDKKARVATNRNAGVATNKNTGIAAAPANKQRRPTKKQDCFY